MSHSWPRKRLLPLPLLLALGFLLAMLPAAASAAPPEEVPDPLDRGPYAPERIDPFKAGVTTHQEPEADGGPPSGSNEPIELKIRGSAFMPEGYPGKSPLILLVHGNHSQCDEGSGPECTVFKRNDEGYAYLAENMASWGYAVFSIDQDELMARQDSRFGKGMHARRLLIDATLDALYQANESGLPETADSNLGESLVDRIDFTRIGLMGHSRGGDAVSSFIDWNRMRPDGRRYPLRGVISLAPVDYERHAPYGTPYMTILPWCDGDVSNLQGARLYERSQQVNDDPYPTIQASVLGGNHNWFNTVWFADGEDGSFGSDAACSIGDPTSSRLSGQAGEGPEESYVIDNSEKLNPEVNTRISGDPARMGDQEKIGLAVMSAFFRRYVGGEGAFDPYMTGELNEVGKPQIPGSACPISPTGTRMPCIERVSNSYFAAPAERLDVIGPDTESPLTKSALGTRLISGGFSNPYLDEGGVTPKPATTSTGLDWCSPEPIHTLPNQLGLSGLPTAVKGCPLPDPSDLGGQNGTRESTPVNQSYGRQLSLAWDDPVAKTGSPATLATPIPAALSDLSGYKALAMGADVNFFDPRNPARTDGDEIRVDDEALWNPAATTQDFFIVLSDGEGDTGVVSAADQRYGNALHQSLGDETNKTHVILDQIRVPLEDFAEDGVDLDDVAKLEFRFGGGRKPKTGSIQLADVRFQEAVDGTDVLVDGFGIDEGPGEGAPSEGPDPTAEIAAFDRSPTGMELPDVTSTLGSNVWTVDDDGVQCPNAQFTKIQDAVDQASPWETIVICDGTYEESSTPTDISYNPVQEGSMNGLTITKPLKIKGTGADKVTIRPAASLGSSLAGTEPFLRDGGGNVITISRQSLGSTDDPEMFVDISGVTVESAAIYAEAGVAFFDTAGRISDSVIGPLKRAADETELAESPHGWGVVVTNHLEGESEGTVLRRVTVDETLVHGYQSGGILFDEAKGPDGSEDAVTPAGVKIEGYVSDTLVEGSGPSALIPQTGIQYHAGAAGFVSHSKITGNLFPTDQRQSVGILLTGADTSDLYAEETAISGNGFGLFNAEITNTAIREAAPALATGNFWGSGGAPVEGESEVGAGIEGVSGEDTEGDPSVQFGGALGSEPGVAGPSQVPDQIPSGAIVDPADGTELDVGETVNPVVLADDDFGIASVTLKADGETVSTASASPYVFSWAPGPGDAGETVTLEATVTDSSGQASASSLEVEVGGEPDNGGDETPPAPDPEPEAGPNKRPLSFFGFKAFRRNVKFGLGVLATRVYGPGVIVIYGPQVRPFVRKPGKAGTVALPVLAKGKARQRLLRTGKAVVWFRVLYRTTGGVPKAKVRRVVLTRRR